MKQVIIYTDGACSGNPGPGGWGAILKYGAHERELSGGEPSTTNNRMELLGAITALQSLREPCQVTLYTDSQYLANAINLGWLRGWKQNRRKQRGDKQKACQRAEPTIGPKFFHMSSQIKKRFMRHSSGKNASDSFGV